jgi:hypothetical protein
MDITLQGKNERYIYIYIYIYIYNNDDEVILC